MRFISICDQVMLLAELIELTAGKEFAKANTVELIIKKLPSLVWWQSTRDFTNLDPDPRKNSYQKDFGFT